MLYFDETMRRLNEKNEIEIIKTMEQGCVVENKNYCARRMNKEPGIMFCKVENFLSVSLSDFKLFRKT